MQIMLLFFIRNFCVLIKNEVRYARIKNARCANKARRLAREVPVVLVRL
jgi:hypothetical protein